MHDNMGIWFCTVTEPFNVMNKYKKSSVYMKAMFVKTCEIIIMLMALRLWLNMRNLILRN